MRVVFFFSSKNAVWNKLITMLFKKLYRCKVDPCGSLNSPLETRTRMSHISKIGSTALKLNFVFQFFILRPRPYTYLMHCRAALLVLVRFCSAAQRLHNFKRTNSLKYFRGICDRRTSEWNNFLANMWMTFNLFNGTPVSGMVRFFLIFIHFHLFDFLEVPEQFSLLDPCISLFSFFLCMWCVGMADSFGLSCAIHHSECGEPTSIFMIVLYLYLVRDRFFTHYIETVFFFISVLLKRLFVVLNSKTFTSKQNVTVL